jgi:hypothetical protein
MHRRRREGQKIWRSDQSENKTTEMKNSFRQSPDGIQSGMLQLEGAMTAGPLRLESIVHAIAMISTVQHHPDIPAVLGIPCQEQFSSSTPSSTEDYIPLSQCLRPFLG